MYIIVEGMPGSGKTTLAHQLAQFTNCMYIKSTLSNWDFGKLIRCAMNDIPEAEIEPYYLTDLLLDELRVSRQLKIGCVVRDKTYTSSLAHLRAHGFAAKYKMLHKILEDGYLKLAELANRPDAVIFLNPTYDEVIKHAPAKKDKSEWDDLLLSKKATYLAQKKYLLRELSRNYKNKLMIFDPFCDSPDNICRLIISRLNKK